MNECQTAQCNPLPEDEQMVQLEEAYARATVAVTRARALCLIMGPHMKGPLVLLR